MLLNQLPKVGGFDELPRAYFNPVQNGSNIRSLQLPIPCPPKGIYRLTVVLKWTH